MLNEKLFGFSSVNSNKNTSVRIFDIWTPNTWHSFCLLIKDKETTFFLDKQLIAKNTAQFEVPS